MRSCPESHKHKGVIFTIQQFSGTLAPPRSPEPLVSFGQLSVFAFGSTSIGLVSIGPSPWCCQSQPWLFPLSTSPWDIVLAALWVSAWLLLLVAPPTVMVSPSVISSISCPSPALRLPPEPLPSLVSWVFFYFFFLYIY